MSSPVQGRQTSIFDYVLRPFQTVRNYFSQCRIEKASPRVDVKEKYTSDTGNFFDKIKSLGAKLKVKISNCRNSAEHEKQQALGRKMLENITSTLKEFQVTRSSYRSGTLLETVLVTRKELIEGRSKNFATPDEKGNKF